MGGAQETAGNHALIFGATGIQGWAVTNQLLQGYPTPESFSKITGLANRPVKEAMLWPESEKFQLVSGIDLLNKDGQAALEAQMKEKIPSVETVSHVFFFAYIFKENPDEEISINVELLKRAVKAVESLAGSNLKFVLLPTGTKAYGLQALADFPFSSNLPLSEDLPRIPEPWRSQNFYYFQTDWLVEESEGKSWTWCEVRPDVVVGFVPNNNVYCLAQQLGTYLACYKEIEGEGAEVPFPGTEKSYSILCNDSSQDVVARFCIYAALNPEKCGQGKAFNVADNSKPSSWSKKWPIICEYFGLKGVGPQADGKGPQPTPYLADHFDEWKAIEKKHGLSGGRVGNDRNLGGFYYFIMVMFDFDRQLALDKMHKAWGSSKEEIDTKTAWYKAFDRFRAAKIIP